MLKPFILGLFITSCAAYGQDLKPAKHVTTVAPGSDADCKAACDNGRKLECDFASATPEGGTCEDVCHNSETSGYTSMHPACIAKAVSCQAADDCANE